MGSWIPEPGDPIIDTRQIIDRIEELTKVVEGDPEDLDAADELEMLQDFANEWSDQIPDWKYGEQMIADFYFVEYAQQLAEDIGAIDRDLGWPACHIDWEAAADSLRMDYFSVEFGHTTYWVR